MSVYVAQYIVSGHPPYCADLLQYCKSQDPRFHRTTFNQPIVTPSGPVLRCDFLLRLWRCTDPLLTCSGQLLCCADVQRLVLLRRQWVEKLLTHTAFKWPGLLRRPTSGTACWPATACFTPRPAEAAVMVMWPVYQLTRLRTEWEVFENGRCTMSGCWLTQPQVMVHGQTSSSYRLPRTVSWLISPLTPTVAIWVQL